MLNPSLPLEDAIGLDAVLKLRDWLINAYPPAVHVTPHSTAQPRANDASFRQQQRERAFAETWGDPSNLSGRLKATQDRIAPKAPRFYAELYTAKDRTWYRVMDRGTGKVAKLPIRQGREFVAQVMFMSLFEAREAIERLESAFGLTGGPLSLAHADFT